MSKTKKRRPAKRVANKPEPIDVTLQQLWGGADAMFKILNTSTLEAVVAFRLSKLVSALTSVEEARRNLIAKYAANGANSPDSGDSGGAVAMQVAPDDMTEFRAEFDTILDEPFDGKVLPLQLNQLETVGLTPFELSSIYFLIVDPDA